MHRAGRRSSESRTRLEPFAGPSLPSRSQTERSRANSPEKTSDVPRNNRLINPKPKLDRDQRARRDRP